VRSWQQGSSLCVIQTWIPAFAGMTEFRRSFALSRKQKKNK
jgi:hypothetical protein